MKRVIIVCSVLVAKTQSVRPHTDFAVPPKTIDTTVSPENLVFVKYNDYEFYPLYMVFYRRTPEDPCRSRHFNGNRLQVLQRNNAAPRQQNAVEEQRRERERRQQQQREGRLVEQERRYHAEQLQLQLHMERKFQQQQQKQQFERERQQQCQRNEINQNQQNCLIL